MKTISIFLYWIATRFWILTQWFDSHDFPPHKIGYFFSKLGRKLYPDGYCRNCGILVDPRIKEFYYDTGWVFNGLSDKNFERPYCSSCNVGPTPKQLEIYQEWRKKHPIRRNK
jgi:hypothetical protein